LSRCRPSSAMKAIETSHSCVVTNALDAMLETGTSRRKPMRGKTAWQSASAIPEGDYPGNHQQDLRPLLHHQIGNGGTGLGLSIARKIAGNHNGKIEVTRLRKRDDVHDNPPEELTRKLVASRCPRELLITSALSSLFAGTTGFSPAPHRAFLPSVRHMPDNRTPL